MKIFQCVTLDRKVMIELREDSGLPIAHIVLEPDVARDVGSNTVALADIADGGAPAPAQPQRH